MMHTNARKIGWDEADATSDVYAPIRDRMFSQDSSLLLIDGRLACYRAFHTRELTSDDGTPTSVLHGLLGMIEAACRAANTRRWMIVWDGTVKYKRAIFPGYKERHDRQRTPEEEAERLLRERAIKVARDALTAIGVPQLIHPDIECDDTIGLVAGMASRLMFAGKERSIGRVIVISDDKDYYQLVSPVVLVWRGGRGELVDVKGFKDRHPFDPENYADYKAFVGEPKTGDNIPGIPGIGDVTASKLIGNHRTWRAVYDSCCEAVTRNKPKPRKFEQAVAAGLATLETSYRLSRIMRAWNDLIPHGLDPVHAKALCFGAYKTARAVNRPAEFAKWVRVQGRFQIRSWELKEWAEHCGFVFG